MHHGLEFMKSVGAFAEDVQDEVDLAGGLFFEAHSERSAIWHIRIRCVGSSSVRLSRYFGRVDCVNIELLIAEPFWDFPMLQLNPIHSNVIPYFTSESFRTGRQIAIKYPHSPCTRLGRHSHGEVGGLMR